MKNTFFGLFCVIILFFTNQSCQKIDATTLGGNLIPGVDNVNTFDTTLEVITDVNFLTDSTGSTYADDQALGVMDDPEFGRTTANMFFEVLPLNQGSDPFIHKDSILGRIDSVVLSLSYKGLYGDSNAAEHFTVYEIAQNAPFKDSLYPATGQDIPVIRTLSQPSLVNFTTLNDPKIVRPGKDTARLVSNVLRIPLDVTLGQRLVNYDTSSAYKSDSAFRTHFRGLAVKPDTTGSPMKKALAYFNLFDPGTRLTVYYRYTLNGVVDTAIAEFGFDSYRSVHVTALFGKSANPIIRNTAGSNYVNNVTDPETNQEKLYIQSAPGSYASIYVPALKTLTNRLIYKAELLVEKLPSLEDNYFTPPVLFLDLMDSANNRFKTVQNDFIGDVNSGSYNLPTFGGRIKNTTYAFDLTRHIQGIVTRKDPVYSFRLYAPSYTYTQYSLPNGKPSDVSRIYPIPFVANPHIAAGRVVLAGGANNPQKMRIRIIYSKI